MNALVIHEGKNITEKKIPNLLYEKFGWTNLFYFNNLKKQTGLMGDNLSDRFCIASENYTKGYTKG